MTPKMQTLLKRTFSTIILLGLVAGALTWNQPIGYAALIGILCNVTSIEWFRMLKPRKDEVNRPLALIAGLIYPWIMALITFSGPLQWNHTMSSFALSALILYALIAFIWELIRMDYCGRNAQQALSSVGLSLLAFIFPVWLFCFCFHFLQSDAGILILVWFILVTKLCDVWAYVSGMLLGGKIFGDRKFSPVVSPRKTWEGIIGSLILTMLSGYGLACWLLPAELVGGNPHWKFALIIGCIFLFAVPGDLAGSLIKRGLGVKDSGSLLPGIGGFFDLIDSPAFTVAAFVGIPMFVQACMCCV